MTQSGKFQMCGIGDGFCRGSGTAGDHSGKGKAPECGSTHFTSVDPKGLTAKEASVAGSEANGRNVTFEEEPTDDLSSEMVETILCSIPYPLKLRRKLLYKSWSTESSLPDFLKDNEKILVTSLRKMMSKHSVNSADGSYKGVIESPGALGNDLQQTITEGDKKSTKSEEAKS